MERDEALTERRRLLNLGAAQKPRLHGGTRGSPPGALRGWSWTQTSTPSSVADRHREYFFGLTEVCVAPSSRQQAFPAACSRQTTNSSLQCPRRLGPRLFCSRITPVRPPTRALTCCPFPLELVRPQPGAMCLWCVVKASQPGAYRTSRPPLTNLRRGLARYSRCAYSASTDPAACLPDTGGLGYAAQGGKLEMP